MNSITLLSGLVIQFYQIPNADIVLIKLKYSQRTIYRVQVIYFIQFQRSSIDLYFVNVAFSKIVTSIKV